MYCCIASGVTTAGNSLAATLRQRGELFQLNPGSAPAAFQLGARESNRGEKCCTSSFLQDDAERAFETFVEQDREQPPSDIVRDRQTAATFERQTQGVIGQYLRTLGAGAEAAGDTEH